MMQFISCFKVSFWLTSIYSIQYTPNLGTTSLETTPWVPVQELFPGVCVLTEAAPSGPAQLLPHQGFLLTRLWSHNSPSHLASTDSRNCSKLHSVSLHQSQSPLLSIPPLPMKIDLQQIVFYHPLSLFTWDWASSFLPRHGDPFTTLSVLISFNHKSQAKVSVQLGEARARQNGWIFWRKSEGEVRIRKIVQNFCIINGNFCHEFRGKFSTKNSETRGGGSKAVWLFLP